MKLVGRDTIIHELQRHIELGGQRTVGFYGVGGIGKTSVLTAATADVAGFTPYVVRLDFTPGSGTHAATEAETILHIIHQLESTGKTAPRRLVGKAASPFEPCLEALGLTPDRKRGLVLQINNIIAKQGSTVQGVNQSNATQSLTDSAITAATHALNQALAHLPVKYQVAHSTALTRPLVVLILDTLERAPRVVVEWLQNQVNGRWQELVLLLAAGRDPVDKLLTRELPRLEDKQARELLAVYGVFKPSVADQLNALCRGIPQCLHIAGQTMERFPVTDPAALIQVEVPEALLQGYLVNAYLEQMRSAFERDGQTVNLREKQIYYLLTCGAILESWDVPSLRVVLTGLEHVGGVFNTDAEFDLILAEAQKRSFLTDRQLHPTLRELALRRLRQDDALWKALNRRAMTYFEERGDAFNALTYQSELDPQAAWEQVTTHYTENPVRYLVIIRRLPPNPIYMDWFALIQLEAASTTNPRDAEGSALQLYEQWTPEHPLFTRLAACIGRLGENGSKEFRLQMQRIEAHRAEDRPAEARAVYELGRLMDTAQKWPKAQTFYRQALELYIALADTMGKANALFGLGEVRRLQGVWAEAARYLEEACGLYMATDNRHGEANVLNSLGYVCQLQGQYDEAEKHLGRARELYVALGNQHGEANVLDYLGRLRQVQGRFNEAGKHLERARELYVTIADQHGEANALLGLADSWYMQGAWEEATKKYEAARELNVTMGNRQGEANALLGLGAVRKGQGRFDEAAEHLKEALQLYVALGSPFGEASTLIELGSVRQGQMKYEEAVEHLKKALQLSMTLGDRLGEASALRMLGTVRREQARYEEAAAHLKEALQMYVVLRNQTGEAITLERLGDLCLKQGHHAEALEYFQAARHLYVNLGSPYGEAYTLRALARCALDQNNCADAASMIHQLTALLNEPASRDIAPQFNPDVVTLQAQLLEKCGAS